MPFVSTYLVTSPPGVVCIDLSCHLTSWCRLYRLILSPHLLVSFITTYLVTSPPGVVYIESSCHLTSRCLLYRFHLSPHASCRFYLLLLRHVSCYILSSHNLSLRSIFFSPLSSNFPAASLSMITFSSVTFTHVTFPVVNSLIDSPSLNFARLMLLFSVFLPLLCFCSLPVVFLHFHRLLPYFHSLPFTMSVNLITSVSVCIHSAF